MAEDTNCTVYVGNIDERVSDRVLYDILIQAGRVVDLHIPRDRETDKPKGFAFAQYETDEIADYAVRLFSGIIILYKKTLKFAISGKDKQSVNLPTSTPPSFISSHKPRPRHVSYDESGVSSNTMRLSTTYRSSDHYTNSRQASINPGVSASHSSGYRSTYDHNDNDYGRRVFGAAVDSSGYRSTYDHNNNDYGRRVFGAAVDSITRSQLGRYGMHYSTNYKPSY